MKDIDEGYTGEAILHVVYYGVDITLVYFWAIWSCFFGRPVFFRPSGFLFIWLSGFGHMFIIFCLKRVMKVQILVSRVEQKNGSGAASGLQANFT